LVVCGMCFVRNVNGWVGSIYFAVEWLIWTRSVYFIYFFFFFYYFFALGSAPFGDTSTLSKFEIFNNINHKNITMPIFMNPDLKSLLYGLLDKDPSKRFDWDSVSSSKWLSDVSGTGTRGSDITGGVVWLGA
jgi:hypothetical protein